MWTRRLCLISASIILKTVSYTHLDVYKRQDYGRSSVLLESVQSEEQNEELIARLKRDYPGRIEIVRGGSVAAEAINRCV